MQETISMSTIEEAERNAETPLDQETASRQELDRYKERLWTLRNGLERLDQSAESSSIVRYFIDLARKQDARLLLLRRLPGGLRIMLAENAAIPERYLDREAETPTLLPAAADDIFAVTGAERTVYRGDLPVDHVCSELLDLVGDEGRPVLVVPLPLKQRWDTYLYMDWPGPGAEDRMVEASYLARFALLRLICLDAGKLPLGQVVRRLSGEAEETSAASKAPAKRESAGEKITAEELYGTSGELMAQPQVALHILELLRDPDTTAGVLEREISRDQVLTGRLLRVANSTFYEGYAEAKTIRDAIVRLGFKNVRNWTLVTAARMAIPDIDAKQLLHGIWRQSMLSAMGCQVVADALQYADRELVFVGGLMQNIGRLIIARARPDLHERCVAIAQTEGLTIWQAEQRDMGFDHGEVGALLIRDWKLGEDLENAVRFHHRLNEDRGQQTLPMMIALGEELGASLTLDELALKAQYASGVAAARLGIGWKQYLGILAQLKETDCEVGL